MKFSQQLLQRVSELHLKTKRTVSCLLSGNYRSAFRGSGMQFKEFRHYEPGDDIRHMAWQVTARTGRATIKTFEEERELDVLIMVDVSGSSSFGTHKRKKIDMYAELVGLLGLAAVKSRDHIGLLLFDDKPGTFLPPRNTRNQVMLAISTVLGEHLEGKRSDLAPSLLYAQQVLKNRSLILVISDFFVPTFDKELRLLAKRHEVVLLHCFDDAERGQLEKGVYEVCDPENGNCLLLDAQSRKTRQALAQHHNLLQHRLEKLSRESNCDYVCLSKEDDYLQRLVHFFRQRGPSSL